uniref:LRRCT domain-containing protein n=1 Tax=Strigamia maritima TaxID=126957 RepID=T1IWA7_STRMM
MTSSVLVFLYLLTTILLPFIESKWALYCPQECNCTLTPAAKWVLGSVYNPADSKKEAYMRSVVCNVLTDTVLIQMLNKIPLETQTLTLIQHDSSKSFVLSDKHFRHIPQLLGLQIQGPRSVSAKRIAVANGWLRSQPKLQHLRLCRVNITAMDSSTFTKLKGLKILHLINVGLRSLPSEFFFGHVALQEISLNQNDIEHVQPSIFSTLPNLKVLSLSRNRLRCFENCTGDLPLPRLQHLDLTGNQIGHISTFTFVQMASLTSLHLEDNPIQVIFPNAFHATPNLQTLTLGYKKQPLHVMPFSFAGLARLTALTLPNIDNNVLEYGMFAGLTSLTHLNIIQGRLQQVTTNAFVGAPNLERISIRECRLKRLYRDAFSGLKYLTRLDLSRNRLVKLNPSAFFGLKRLQELFLQQNQLDVLPRRFFNVIPNSLGSLRLEGNPWNCTCEAGKWKSSAVGRVRKEGATEVKYVRDRSVEPLCHVPKQFSGKPVMDVLKKQLKCFKKKYSNT